MKKFFLISFFVLAGVAGLAARLSERNVLMLDSLTQALELLPERRDMRINDMRALRHQRDKLPPSAGRMALGEQLGRAYVAQDIDSAALYYSLASADAVTVNDHAAAMRIHMRLLSLMPTMGITREAISDIEAIDYASLPPEMRNAYWLATLEIYHGSQRAYPEGVYKDNYRRLTMVAIDSLLHYYPRQSAEHAYLMGHRYLLTGENNIAVAHFVESYPALAQDKPELADFALRYITEYYSKYPKHRQMYLSYLMRRVTMAMRRGIVRPAATAKLGRELYNEGYPDLGRELMSLGLHTQDRSYVAAVEPLEASEFSHFITDETKQVRRVGIVWLVILGVVLVAALILLASYYIKNRRLAADNENFRGRIAIIIDESRCTNQSLVMLAFLALEQLREYNVHVMRKLKANQVKDLYADVEGGKYVQRLNEKYFESFDTTFLATFPNFFAKLNDLLLPERRMPLPTADHLTPEQRIAAFMRLGVTDSQRLAQVLGLSLNTIYTYRNRLRGRAINRDTIESDLATIQ